MRVNREFQQGDAENGTTNTTQGHLDTYRFCDEVWTFLIKDVTFKMEHATVQADKVKIVSCGTKKTE
jgi:transcription initiation factor TFIIA small subunit